MTRYWFISTQYRQSSKLALFTVLLAFFVILLGAYTRLTDAGLSCPDWPHCFGYITAPHTPTQLETAAQRYPAAAIDVKKAWTEMTHRYFAGAEGILILILSCTILFGSKAKDIKSVIIALSLIALLCVQVMLGMLTVTQNLKPVIVLAHLITGLSILSVLWWAYLSLNMHHDLFSTFRSTSITPFLWLAFFIIAAQITLGGWVSTHYAGLACVDFPYCNGNLLPNIDLKNYNSDLITIHMLHRIGAMITGIYFGILALALLFNQHFRSIAILLLLLICCQITLGILNIIWLRPVWVALLHHGVGILLLLTVITALVKASFIAGKRYGNWAR